MAVPAAAIIALLGLHYPDEWNLKSVNTLNMDVVLMYLGKLYQAQDSGAVEEYEEAGIPTFSIDFRHDPATNTVAGNTVANIQVLGRVLDRRDEEDEFIDFYIRQMNRIFATVD